MAEKRTLNRAGVLGAIPATTLAALLLAAWMPLAAVAEVACYRADGDSGELNFRGEAEGTPFSGFFDDFEVRLCTADGGLAGAEIEVRVSTSSVTVGNRQGDEALRGSDLLAVEQFPEAIWISEGVEASGDGYRAQGRLSLREVSADQAVNLNLEQDGESWWLSGDAEILRLEFNVGTGEFDDPEFIRNRVDLRFELKLEPVAEN